ncbi:hypothetical protein [Amycolatopsis sp. NPDC004378]
MTRLLRPRRARKPRPPACAATAVVHLPGHYTRHAGAWRPGAPFVELSLSRVWARREPGGLLRVLTVDDPGGNVAALVCGDLPVPQALGLHRSPDAARRLRELALPGSLTEKPLRYPHRAVIYRRWCNAVQQIADCNARLADLPRRTWDSIDLTRGRDAGFQLVVRVTARRESQIDQISTALLRLTAFYNPGACLRLHPASAGLAITDPIRAAALDSLGLDDVETPPGT